MSKLRKVSGKEAIRALKNLGFVKVRQRGSHVILKKQTLEGDVGCVNSNISNESFISPEFTLPESSKACSSICIVKDRMFYVFVCPANIIGLICNSPPLPTLKKLDGVA